MKKLFCMSLLLLLCALSACMTSVTTSILPITTSETTTTTSDSLGLSLFMEDRTSTVNYLELGFWTTLFEPADWRFPEGSIWNRTDGVLNPFLTSSPNLRQDYEPTIYDHFESYIDYFPIETYQLINMSAIVPSYAYYAYFMEQNDGFVLRFFTYDAPYIAYSSFPGYFVDIIESNGVYSYILNAEYFGRNTNVKQRFYEAFHSIYHEDEFPYAVYFSDHQIFLITKDDNFSKDCIYQFHISGDVRLFKW